MGDNARYSGHVTDTMMGRIAPYVVDGVVTNIWTPRDTGGSLGAGEISSRNGVLNTVFSHNRVKGSLSFIALTVHITIK